MTEKITPELAVRLLRAKTGELEAQVRAEAQQYGGIQRPVTALAADVALIATLLADHIERSNPDYGPQFGEEEDQTIAEKWGWQKREEPNEFGRQAGFTDRE